MRKITVSGKKFLFKIGTGTIEIRDENRTKKVAVDVTAFTGLTPSEVERGHWKRTLMIKPSHIAAYIKRIGWAT